jgi:hypothetical protein
MIKFKIKPSNQTIELPTSSTVQSILNDPIYTVSIRKNGPPIGDPNSKLCDLLSSKTIVPGDILWKVLNPTFGLPNFCDLLQQEISKTQGTSEIITANQKNAVVEAKIQNVEMSLLVSRLGNKNELNIMLTLTDSEGNDSSENFMVKLDIEGISSAIYKMKTSASNFLSVPVAGILELPNVILTQVFQYLKAADLCRICCVNTRMKTMSEDDDLWKTQFENTYEKLGYEKLQTENHKQAYKSAFITEKHKEEQRKLEAENNERIRNRLRDDNSSSLRDNNLPSRFGAPIVPGMIGGRHDVDPFAPSPFGMPGIGTNPRGGPIYGPDGNEIFQPGAGGGLGSDDFPFNPHDPRDPRNMRDPRNPRNPRNMNFPGGRPGFGSFQPPFM